MDSQARGLAASARSIARARLKSVPIVAAAGDSFYNLGYITGTNTLYNSNHTALYWLRLQFADRMYHNPEVNFAVGGTTTQHLIDTQAAQVVASGASIVLVNDYTNDNGVIALATSIANMKAFLAVMAANGISVIWNRVIPQGSWSQASIQRAEEFNRQLYLASLNPAHTLNFVDLAPVMIDHATGLAITGSLISDNVHPNINGGYLMSTAIAPVLDKLLPITSSPFPTTASDSFDATLNPTGNLVQGVMFAGTSGGTNNGGSGSVATRWSGGFATSGGTTLTGVFSKGTKSGYTNLPTQILTMGGTSDGNTFRLEHSEVGGAAWVAPTGLVAGDKIYAQIGIEAASLVNIKSIVLRLSTTVGATPYEVQDGAAGTISAVTTGALPSSVSGWLRTPPLTLPSGFGALRFRVEVTTVANATATSGTLAVRQAQARKAGIGVVAGA